MPRCCPGVLPPKIEEGRHVELTGTGTPQDPYVISATTMLDTIPNDTFNIIIAGNGTLEDPWQLSVIYATTSRLEDIGDVVQQDPTPNGYVLAWDATNARWQTAPPSVAPLGAVLTGSGLTGDGSAPNPLNTRTTGYLVTTPAGINLSDLGINSLVRAFANATTRSNATPAPVAGAVSLLLSDPSQLWYYDGDSWEPITNGIRRDIQPGEFLALSGGYSGGATTQYVAQLSELTDSTGAFEVIPAADLVGYSGVLSCSVQESGATPWHCQVAAGLNNVIATAWDVTSGTVQPNVTVTGTVTALLY